MRKRWRAPLSLPAIAGYPNPCRPSFCRPTPNAPQSRTPSVFVKSFAHSPKLTVKFENTERKLQRILRKYRSRSFRLSYRADAGIEVASILWRRLPGVKRNPFDACDFKFGCIAAKNSWRNKFIFHNRTRQIALTDAKYICSGSVRRLPQLLGLSTRLAWLEYQWLPNENRNCLTAQNQSAPCLALLRNPKRGPKAGLAASFPSSASALQPGGWMHSPNCSNICPPIQAWALSWCNTSIRSMRAP